jgi:methyltransferase (TIGR00027 family)
MSKIFKGVLTSLAGQTTSEPCKTRSKEKKGMLEKVTSGYLLGSTAHWTAGVRAKESAREDRLFNDPWAAALAGQEGQAWMEQRTANSVIPIVLRTRFFDDFLQRITRQNGVQQIVLLGAGLDTRAFRLNWPEQTRFFELDQPQVLNYKEQILRSAGAQPACARQAIEVDLTGPWQETLFKAGFEPQQPSGWLLEGFLFYLSNERLTHLLDKVTSLAVPGSWLGFDIINSAVLTSPWTQQWVEMQAKSGAPWIGTMDDPEGFLAARGWRAILSQAGANDANHGRWPYPIIPTTMHGMPHNWFVTAQKEVF